MGLSLFRALGIPCRCVTNYMSAHDTGNSIYILTRYLLICDCNYQSVDGSLTVDKFYDVDGDTLGTGSYNGREDSVWNFHVWNGWF